MSDKQFLTEELTPENCRELSEQLHRFIRGINDAFMNLMTPLELEGRPEIEVLRWRYQKALSVTAEMIHDFASGKNRDNARKLLKLAQALQDLNRGIVHDLLKPTPPDMIGKKGGPKGHTEDLLSVRAQVIVAVRFLKSANPPYSRKAAADFIARKFRKEIEICRPGSNAAGSIAEWDKDMHEARQAGELLPSVEGILEVGEKWIAKVAERGPSRSDWEKLAVDFLKAEFRQSPTAGGAN